jgi:hypothetical protein
VGQSQLGTGRLRPLADILADDHGPLMPTAEENSPPYTEADYYGFVLTGLFGVIDDAEALHCDAAGITLLRQAADMLWAEFKQRHPGA